MLAGTDVMLEMLRKADRCYKWGIYDRDPLERWVSHRAVLLGDAAHPMMPTLAQGAAISIEDGYALARNFSEVDDIDGALAAYQRERVPRASARAVAGTGSVPGQPQVAGAARSQLDLQTRRHRTADLNKKTITGGDNMKTIGGTSPDSSTSAGSGASSSWSSCCASSS